MILVTITNPATGTELGRIEVQNLQTGVGEVADYSVKFGVERGTAVGMHKRMIYGFPRKKYNVLALLRQALETLNEKELELERDFDPDAADRSPNLARKIRGARRKV